VVETWFFSPFIYWSILMENMLVLFWNAACFRNIGQGSAPGLDEPNPADLWSTGGGGNSLTGRRNNTHSYKPCEAKREYTGKGVRSQRQRIHTFSGGGGRAVGGQRESARSRGGTGVRGGMVGLLGEGGWGGGGGGGEVGGLKKGHEETGP